MLYDHGAAGIQCLFERKIRRSQQNGMKNNAVEGRRMCMCKVYSIQKERAREREREMERSRLETEI